MLVHMRPGVRCWSTVSSHPMRRCAAGSVSGHRAADGTARVQSPFARDTSSGRRAFCLLGGHYPFVVATTNSRASPPWLSSPSALASFEESWRVATSPRCQQDLPDVISANLSSDAWSLATAVSQSARACFFPCVIGLPSINTRSASRFVPRTQLYAGWFSRLQTFLYVQASDFARLPGCSYRCTDCCRAAEAFTSGPNVLRYLRTHRIC